MNTPLLAPNGQPTNLTPQQYHLVRTPAFKAWFGDWENNPANASKVIDENGEPLVVYHGSSNNQINIFEIEKAGTIQYSDWGKGIYFTPSKGTALYYSAEAQKKNNAQYNHLYDIFQQSQSYDDLKAFQQKGRELSNPENPIIYEVFLNIKKPLIEPTSGMNDPYLSERAKSNKKDGIFIMANYTMFDEIIVFSSNQIKLADGTNTTFNINTPDIRFEQGGEIYDWDFEFSNGPDKGKKFSSLKIDTIDVYDDYVYSLLFKDGSMYNAKTSETVGLLSITDNVVKIAVILGNEVKSTQRTIRRLQKLATDSNRVIVENNSNLRSEKRLYPFLFVSQNDAFNYQIAEQFIGKIDTPKKAFSKKIIEDAIASGSFLQQIKAGRNKNEVIELIKKSGLEVPDEILNFAKGGTITQLLAPNGKPTNLTPQQYQLVRTPAFKAWFGDWENDPANASKIIDENGEPLVVYHGTPDGRFTIFDETTFGKRTNNINSIAFFFTPSIWYAEAYSQSKNNETIKIYEDLFGEKPKAVEPKPYAEEKMCFLKIKNPYYALSQTKDDLIFAKTNGYDGLILKYQNRNEFFEIAAFSSNQIKLADGTNTTFSEKNNDIRYANGGAIKNTVMLKNNSLEEKLKEKINVMLDLCNSSETPVICGMLQTSADRFQLVDVLAHKVVMEKLDIEQAIIALDNEYNQNTLN